ncbi:MAG: SMP-30/gluconolactonase/LRE family protein [Balneolaceae bacterium]|nr:MAG: SMP-30/gluconolactonase/LRE family protein [Balneolaceae bacterium]
MLRFLFFPLFSLFLILLLTACDTPEPEFALGEPEEVTSGFRFTEGPYWHPDGFLLFSDIPANIIYKWVPGTTESEIYITPSGNSNGIKGAPDGTILVAQHAGRVSRITAGPALETIVSEYEGNRLNSPNDIAVRSDGKIYFTDPDFGVSDEEKELDVNGVYRIDSDGSLTLVFGGFQLPNGLVFSPDETYLYVNDSATGNIFRFEVTEEGDLHSGDSFANIGAMGRLGGADGMVVDSEGRLYTTGPNGLIVLDPEGEQVAQIVFEHQITNLAWEGGGEQALYITSPNSVYKLEVVK